MITDGRRSVTGTGVTACDAGSADSLKVSVNDRWGTVDSAASVQRWLEDDVLRFLGEQGQEPHHGNLGDHGNLTVLAGFSGHGFKLSPVFGELAAQLAIEGGTEQDLDRFSAQRSLIKKN